MVGFHHHKRERERDGCSIHFIRFPCFIYTFVETNCTRLWIVSFNIFVSFPMHCVFFFLSVNKRVSKDSLFTYYSNRIGLIFSFEQAFTAWWRPFFFFFFFLVKIKESYGRFLLFSSLNTLLRGILKS